MGDQTQQQGPDEFKKSSIEGEDVEGHRRPVKLTGDEPGPSEAKKVYAIESDEDDVEGHRHHTATGLTDDEDDVEGHRFAAGKLTDDEDDVEGHRVAKS